MKTITNPQEIIEFLDKQIKTSDEKKNVLVILEKESHKAGHYWEGMKVTSRVTNCEENTKTIQFDMTGAPFARLNIDQTKIVSLQILY